jgi:hypothetical protein
MQSVSTSVFGSLPVERIKIIGLKGVDSLKSLYILN